MRVALFSFIALLLVSAAGSGQDTKKKDTKSESTEAKEMPEPKEIAGKSFEQWLAEIHSTDPSKRENAMQSIGNFGPKKAQQAVPAILAELKKHKFGTPVDLTVRVAGISTLGTILTSVKEPDAKNVKDAAAIFKSFTRDEQVLVRTRAAQAMGQLAFFSKEVRDAIDDVDRVANDTQTWQARQAGVQALVRVAIASVYLDKKPPSPRVLATLEKHALASTGAFKEHSMLVRIAAVQALSQLPLASFNAGDEIRRERTLETVVKKDPEPSVRIWAELALMTVKKKLDPEHLGGIIKYLNFKADPAIRIQAANSLGMLSVQPAFGAKDPKNPGKALDGPERQLVVRELITGLKDPDPTVVSACINALFMAEPQSATGPVAAMLDDEQPLRRAQGAQALGMLGDKARPAESLLISKLNTEKNLEVLGQVITALVQMVSLDAVPVLEKMAATPRSGPGGEVIQQAAKDAARIIVETKARLDKQAKTPKNAK